MVGVSWRVILLGVCALSSLVVSCGEGHTLAANRDAGHDDDDDDDDDDEEQDEAERGLCSPTIGACTLDSSSGCPSAQPGNDLACEDDGATCHYCPVYNESVSVSRCTDGRWVNTRATCED